MHTRMPASEAPGAYVGSRAILEHQLVYNYTGAGGAESLRQHPCKECWRSVQCLLASISATLTWAGGERQKEQVSKKENQNLTFCDPK